MIFNFIKGENKNNEKTKSRNVEKKGMERF